MRHARTAYEVTAKAREHYAREVFDLAQVKQAIENRAAEGYRDLRLFQTHQFDLSWSTSAKALEDWLDTNQYRYAWSQTQPILDPLYSSTSEVYPELVIFW